MPTYQARRSLATALFGTAAVFAIAATASAAPINYYWTARDAATLNKTTAGGTTTMLFAHPGERLQDVDLDAGTNTLYYTSWGAVGLPGGEGTINKIGSNGLGQAMVHSTGDGVHQIAISGNQIYYTRGVSYDAREVAVVNKNGTGYTVLQSETSWFPSGIAVDAGAGKVYWGDIGVIPFLVNGAVNVMNTDGTGATILEPHVDGRGRGFALYGGSIYLTAHDPGTPALNGAIFRYDIGTDTLTLLLQDAGCGVGGTCNGFWDIEIDPVGQRMYFTNYAAGTIESAKLDGSDRQVELSGLGNVYGLALEFAPVPEPTALTLLGLGLAGLGLLRRRRSA